MSGRYALFTFNHYYPSGGWHDLKERGDDLIRLEVLAKEHRRKRDPNEPDAHIVDLETGEVLEQ